MSETTNGGSDETRSREEEDIICPLCGAKYPTGMKNRDYHVMAHGYLFHPPEPGEHAPPEKRENVNRSKQRLKEKGLYQ